MNDYLVETKRLHDRYMLDEKKITWGDEVWLAWHADYCYMLEQYNYEDEALLTLPDEELITAAENEASGRNEEQDEIPCRRKNEFFLTLPSMLWLVGFFRHSHDTGHSHGLQERRSLRRYRKPVDTGHHQGPEKSGLSLHNLAHTVAQRPFHSYLYRNRRTGKLLYFKNWKEVSGYDTAPDYCSLLDKFSHQDIRLEGLPASRGLFKQLLMALHLAGPDTLLLYRPAAVLVVIVYSYLPFALLPIYASAEKFNFSLMEAAYDLGASRFQAFLRVYIPA